MPTTSMGKTMTSFWMDSRTPEDSRWHSKHEGDFHTEDRLADHFVGKLRDECRGETSELAIMVRFTRMLKELLDPYESQDNLLLRLADTGRVATLLHQYIDNALDMLKILDPVQREEWHTQLLKERQDRLKVFEEFVKDDAKLLAACGSKNQQLEIVTLLRYCVEKYHDGLTPFAGAEEKYRDKLLGEELDTIAMVYELVVRKANVVSGTLPEWFFTSEHEWAWVSKAKVEDSKNAWNKTAREKFLEGKAGSEVRGVMSEEVCVRLASIWTELNHPHLRKFYGASHVGIPFVIHETCYSPSHEKEKNVWHYASNYALGLQYVHDRGLVYHDVSPATFLCSYSERRGVMDGLGLVSRSEAGRSFQAVESMESLMARDVLRFGISIFCLLAGVRNLTRPSESRDKTFDSWKYGSTKSLPEVRPQFITETEWGILQSLCTSDPAKRSGLVDAAYAMKLLDPEDEVSKSKDVDLSDLEGADVNTYIHSFTQATAANTLDEINAFCNTLDGPERLSINWRVYTRLDNIHKQLQILRPLPTKRLLGEFCQLLNKFSEAFDKDDKMDSCQAPSAQVTHTVAGINSRYHHEIDDFIRKSPRLQDIDVCHQWQPFWEQDQQAQQALFKSCLDSPAEFLDNVERARWAEAVSVVKFEAHNRPGAYSSDVVAKVNLALQEALKRAEDVPELRIAQIGEPLPKWFVMNYQIHLGKKIGAGGFGTVYEGKWFGTDVVVKLQKVADDIKPEERAKFRQEADLWFSLNHSNLIKLYGACYEGKQPFFVCERATRQTLKEYLRRKYHERWFRLLQAAQGLQHLHEHNIVHGDLKGDNILVCEGGATKLADFGLSILASTSENKTLTTAALQWKAPECLDDKNHPTFASDIYAFGMCIIEAVTGTCPWGMLSNNEVTYALKKGKIPTKSDKFKPHEWELVEQMCCFDSQKRIGIGAVIKILEDIGVKHLLDRAGMMGTARTEGNT